MTKINLLSVDRALAQRLTDAMGDRVTVEMVQSLETADLAGPGLIVIDHAAVSSERSLASTISAVAESAPGRAIVLATDDMYAAQVLLAIRAGAADVVPRNAERSEIAGIFTRILNSAILSQGRPGRLTLLLGADREAAAILATDMALAHSLNQTPTLLVDFTLPTSTAEAYLDLKVDYGLASAVADIERLDASLLADALARHEPSGLALLTFDGGTGSEPVGIEPNDIVNLIHLLRAACGNVVLCAGSLRNSGLLRELASQAQSIEVVCSQSIRELDTCRRLLDRIALDTASMDRLRLLVWDHDPAILLDGRRMADVLGIEAVMGIPTDRVRTRNALNSGRPLYLDQDRGPYVQAIRRACAITAPPKGAKIGFDKVRRAILRSVERTA
ncbi:AAA family ATPase [Novosphingobium album (ex Liu et al. 2023)]|uniref:Histidine kinase n=1 Tax=Novosphingobium album (ex Liu et al. 2023) TaxID=3031130 RepID=A0ABT5WKC6_9SPHN|nr:histidine kinase [Novosphingobium album (ex Liu et al. 2023)]MDE8650500.1 histidine kinase [Novosphingobium album (ex Liu et al. 2023)]